MNVHPEPQNITLFGNRVFADVIILGSQDEIILDLDMALNPMTRVFMIRAEDSDTQSRSLREDGGRN